MSGEKAFKPLGGCLIGALVFILVCCGAISNLLNNLNPFRQPPPTANEKILINKASIGKVLDARDKNKRQVCFVHLWHPLNKCQDQRWLLRDIADGHFTIVDKVSGFVLDANAQQVQNNGCPVTLSPANNAFNQQWRTQQFGEYVKIINRASGKILTASTKDVFKNGCRIQLEADNNSDEGLWKLQ